MKFPDNTKNNASPVLTYSAAVRLQLHKPNLTQTLTDELKNGKLVTPALEKIHTNFGFVAFVLFSS